MARLPGPIQLVFMTLSAVLTHDPGGGYVALNPETGTTTQGDSVVEAIAHLKEATGLYLAEFPLESPRPALMTTFQVAHSICVSRSSVTSTSPGERIPWLQKPCLPSEFK